MGYNSFVYDLFESFLCEDKIDPICIVEFRTDYDYDGSFGFDWLRIDEPQAVEPPYKDIIQGGFKNGKTDLSKDEAYKKLENEYKKIYIRRRPFTAPWLAGREKYFVPYLNLFSKEYSDKASITPKPTYKAKLCVLIEIDEDIEKIEFSYNKELFTVDTSDLIPITKKCKQIVAGSITIQCNKDFNQEQEINVYAYPLGSFFMSKIEQESQKTLAGRLILRPNSAIHREEVEMVFVCVKTNVAGKTQKGSFADSEREQMCRTLYQALIKPDIYSKRKTATGSTDIVMDVSKDPNFLQKGKYIDPKGKLNEDADRGSMFSYLRKKFMGDPNNAAYKNCFPIFAFGIRTYDGTAGQVEKIGVKNLVLFQERNYNPQVIGHESLHGYGLWHTHRELSGESVITTKYKKYIYPHGHYDPQNATDNIMSYRFGSMITTWKWQWDIIKKFT